jgi:hypothetical protein
MVSVQHAPPEAFFLTCSTRIPPNQVAIVSP